MLRSQRLFIVSLELIGLSMIVGNLLGEGAFSLAFDPTKLFVIGTPIQMDSGYKRPKTGSADEEQTRSGVQTRGEQTFRDSGFSPHNVEDAEQTASSNPYKLNDNSSYAQSVPFQGQNQNSYQGQYPGQIQGTYQGQNMGQNPQQNKQDGRFGRNSQDNQFVSLPGGNNGYPSDQPMNSWNANTYNAGNQYPEQRQNTSRQYTDASRTDNRYAGGQYTNTPRTDNGYVGSQYTNTPQTDNRYVGSQYANAPQTDNRYTTNRQNPTQMASSPLVQPDIPSFDQFVQSNHDKKPEQAHDVLSLADVAYQNGRFNDAESLYHQYLSCDISTLDRESVSVAYHRLGLVARKRQQYETAMDYLLKAIQASPNQNSEITFDYARILFDIGQFDRAEVLLTHLHRNNPDDQQIQFYLAQASLRLGRYANAFELLKNIVGKENACEQIAKQASEQGDADVADEMHRYLHQININRDQQFFLGEDSLKAVSDPVFSDTPTLQGPTAQLAMTVPQTDVMTPDPVTNPTPVQVPNSDGKEVSISKLFLPAFTEYLDGKGSNPVSDGPIDGTVSGGELPELPQDIDIVTQGSPAPQGGIEEPYRAAYQSSDAWLGNSHPGLTVSPVQEQVLPEQVPEPVPATSPIDGFEEEVWGSAKSSDYWGDTESVPMTQNQQENSPGRKSSEEKLAEAIAAGASIEYLSPEQYDHEIATRAGTVVRTAREDAQKAAKQMGISALP